VNGREWKTGEARPVNLATSLHIAVWPDMRLVWSGVDWCSPSELLVNFAKGATETKLGAVWRVGYTALATRQLSCRGVDHGPGFLVAL